MRLGCSSPLGSGRVRGKEGGELRKFSVEAVYFTINTKGLGGREEKDVTLICAGTSTSDAVALTLLAIDSSATDLITMVHCPHG